MTIKQRIEELEKICDSQYESIKSVFEINKTLNARIELLLARIENLEHLERTKSSRN